MKYTKISIVAVALLVIVGGILFLFRPKVTVHPLERKLSIMDSSREAQLVVVGTLGKGSEWSQTNSEGNRLVFTDWSVTPTEVWKGISPADLKVTVVGGSNIAVQVEDESLIKFRTGMTALFYLTRSTETGKWVPLSVNQTVFTKQGGEYVNPVGERYTVSVLQSSLLNK